MARILIVTGRLAEPLVRKAVEVSKTKHLIDIVVAPIDVAALMSTEYIANFLKSIGIDKAKYDFIVVPGLSKGSAKVIEDVVGVRAVKGFINVYDLPELLSLDDLGVLSSDKPADEVIQGIVFEKNKRLLIEVENSITSCLVVGNVCVPINPPPMRVISEVVVPYNALSEDLSKKITYLIDSGADIVGIGFEGLGPRPEDVYRIVRFVKDEFDIPIAVDTSIPSEIIKGVEAGCDMVLNVDMFSMDKVIDKVKDVAVVIIPRDSETGSIPRDPSKRVALLSRAIDYARSRGLTKVLADPVLDTPGSTFNSMLAFNVFKKVFPEVPMVMGLSNVVEFMDVDSVGVNATLTLLAQEIGVSVVLTTESSVKTLGSTREVKIASQMMTLAKVLNTSPQNLGISLLVLKDRKRIETPIEETNVEIVVASEEEKEYPLDPLGIFKIAVDHVEGCIKALYIGRKGRILIKARSAKAIRNEILSRGLVSSLSHAMYLGIELAKAEEALRIGKNYVQELPLFEIPKPINLRKETEVKTIKN